MIRAYADVVFERVEREMQTPPLRVKLIYSAQGVFVNRTLQEQTAFFLTRAAQQAEMFSAGKVSLDKGKEYPPQCQQ